MREKLKGEVGDCLCFKGSPDIENQIWQERQKKREISLSMTPYQLSKNQRGRKGETHVGTNLYYGCRGGCLGLLNRLIRTLKLTREKYYHHYFLFAFCIAPFCLDLAVIFCLLVIYTGLFPSSHSLICHKLQNERGYVFFIYIFSICLV